MAVRPTPNVIQKMLPNPGARTHAGNTVEVIEVSLDEARSKLRGRSWLTLELLDE